MSSVAVESELLACNLSRYLKTLVRANHKCNNLIQSDKPVFLLITFLKYFVGSKPIAFPSVRTTLFLER